MNSTTESPISHSESYQERIYRDLDSIVSAMHPCLWELETERQQAIANQQKRKPVGIAILVVSALCFFIPVLGFFAFFGIIGGAIYAFGRFGNFKQEYKTRIITKLVELIDPNLRYTPDQGLEQSYFDRSRLFKTTPNRYKTEDLITGKFEGVDVAFAEVDATYRTSGKNSSTRQIFKGILFVADFHKHTQGQTYIFKNNGEFMLDTRAPRGTKKVVTEDVNFNHCFEAFTTDQVEARYVLSPSMMQRLVGLKNRLNEDIRIAILDGCVIVAIPHGQYLEPNFDTSANCPAQIKTLLEQILSLLTMAKEMNLETRIWSKH